MKYLEMNMKKEQKSCIIKVTEVSREIERDTGFRIQKIYYYKYKSPQMDL